MSKVTLEHLSESRVDVNAAFNALTQHPDTKNSNYETEKAVTVHALFLKSAVMAADFMDSDEKNQVIELLNAVLESGEYVDAWKIQVFIHNAFTTAANALEIAMANAEMSEFNEEEITYE